MKTAEHLPMMYSSRLTTLKRNISSYRKAVEKLVHISKMQNATLLNETVDLHTSKIQGLSDRAVLLKKIVDSHTSKLKMLAGRESALEKVINLYTNQLKEGINDTASSKGSMNLQTGAPKGISTVTITYMYYSVTLHNKREG